MGLFKLLASLFAIVVASTGILVLHEHRAVVPSRFVSKGAVPTNEVLTLRVGLALNHLVGLETKLTSVATPGSHKFRQWLSKDEVKAFVQPSPETVSAFTGFASANSLKTAAISPNGEWWSITLPSPKQTN
ncbi:hypothetical protein DFH08DRAFT_1081184 [Mycena albidolilacea]|uniref:Peptidase S53 activation domain-containing protein n=1 Tax=Mycena albidolilacea TaxID=1033008 RepID=A0AAD6ZYT0_9AGAR|nr:hypothetical protein DFH08DRAFT_1081184 [Mycena albidolilacea]